ncbi:MAG TPA: hypothetical protein VF932_09330, partial [Anaerolineae bacterium]
IAGAVGVSANGISADHVGIMPTMLTNAALPLVASALAFLLPDDRPGLQAEELSDPGISGFGD